MGNYLLIFNTALFNGTLMTNYINIFAIRNNEKNHFIYPFSRILQ